MNILLKVIIIYLVISFLGFYLVLKRELFTALIDPFVGLVIFLIVFKILIKNTPK